VCIDKILLLFGNVLTMDNLSNEDKMLIHSLHEQGFGAKVIRVSYLDLEHVEDDLPLGR